MAARGPQSKHSSDAMQLLPIRPLGLLALPLVLQLLPAVANQQTPTQSQDQQFANTFGDSRELFTNTSGSEGPGNVQTGQDANIFQESSNYGSAESQQLLTCTARCPSCSSQQRCPQCTTPMCPSPCPSIPEFPEPQKCPSPCTACPACPACKRPIPPGYEYFQGLGYYRLHNVPQIWTCAKATCEREGAHLAIINSQEEANLMKTLVDRHPGISPLIFLGFHDLFQEGKYVTLFGQPLEKTGYTTWQPSQPDNYKIENCGSMWVSVGLNDLNCSAKQPFVCEFPV